MAQHCTPARRLSQVAAPTTVGAAERIKGLTWNSAGHPTITDTASTDQELHRNSYFAYQNAHLPGEVDDGFGGAPPKNMQQEGRFGSVPSSDLCRLYVD